MTSSDVSAYAATIQALTAIVLVWLTGRYVRLTAGMVAEMRGARQPTVYIDVEIEHASGVVLIIGNSGDAPARHIKFTVDDGVPWQGRVFHRPADLTAIKDGLPYLAPNRHLRFMLGHLDWKKATEERGWLNFIFSYEGEEGRKFSHTANIDLHRYNGLMVDSFSTPEHEIADSLKSWFHLVQQESLQKSVRPFPRLCPACASPMPQSASKCSACLEWLPGKEPVTRDSDTPAS